MMKYFEKDFKSILNVRKMIDGWFWDKYGINPYNGCQFGCVYCDSRSQKYYLPLDFENTIVIKKNIGEILDSRLKNARTLPADVVGIGGTTDPYQPAETLYKNTLICLEILLKYGYPVHICTKSRLVARDMNLLEEIGRKSWCTVSFTITTMNSDKARFLEQNAPGPELRLEALSTLKQKTSHVQAGILLMPAVPGITDDYGEMEDLIKKAKDAGAGYIIFGAGLTLRDLQAGWYLKHLNGARPELIPFYEELYHFQYNGNFYSGSYMPAASYAIKISNIFFELCGKHNMPCRIKRFIPDDYRKDNYRIAEGLLNRSYFKQSEGASYYNDFWAGQNIQNLKEPIRDIAVRNELKKIRSVDDQIEALIKKELNLK